MGNSTSKQNSKAVGAVVVPDSDGDDDRAISKANFAEDGNKTHKSLEFSVRSGHSGKSGKSKSGSAGGKSKTGSGSGKTAKSLRSGSVRSGKTSSGGKSRNSSSAVTVNNIHNHTIIDHKHRNRLVLYSDFTCPYCYLEFIRLTRAMEKLPKKQRMLISHGPFQLDNSLSGKGVDKYEFLSKIIPPSALDPMIDILCDQFQELDLQMHRRGVIGNSAPAHRLQIWAEEHCPPQQALDLKDALFRIHSCEGKSMSDTKAIVAAASGVGLDDEPKIRAVLKDTSYGVKLKQSIKYAKNDLAIQSVPCLLVIKKNGEQRKLEEATGIETISGFEELIVRNI